MINLEYYRSPEGLYVAKAYLDWQSTRGVFSREFTINDIVPEPTHHRAWVFIPGAETIESLKFMGYVQWVNPRWVLDDSTPEPIKALVPEEISCEDAHEWYDDDDCETYMSKGCEYYEYRAFFTRVKDKTEPGMEAQEFTARPIADVNASDVSKPSMTYSVVVPRTSKNKDTVALDDIASYDELAHILTTDLLIHNQPCSASSSTTYKIVRKHVLDNIDPKWAIVTSNYDFCFTVQKKVAVKPFIRTTEQKKPNGHSYARPRIAKHTVDHKKVIVFEMTHSPKNYQGYTPIKGFRGDNLQDLHDNIERYLAELMEHINAPLSECQHCQGMGHVMQDHFKLNGERT